MAVDPHASISNAALSASQGERMGAVYRARLDDDARRRRENRIIDLAAQKVEVEARTVADREARRAQESEKTGSQADGGNQSLSQKPNRQKPAGPSPREAERAWAYEPTLNGQGGISLKSGKFETGLFIDVEI